MMECQSQKSPSRGTSLSYKTPLAQAIMAGNIKSLDELLCAGADINEYSYFRGHGEAPLLTAVRYARDDMVTVLLSHGANVNLTSSRGHTPLLRAAQRNYFQMLCQLLSHRADPNAVDTNGCSALFWAVKLRNISAAMELIKYGANVNTRTKVTTILHTAISVDCSDMTKLLLEHGAEVNIRDEFGETPLFPAVRVDNMDIVEMLLDRGSNVNALNDDCRSPLHLSAASVHNNVDLAQLLLDHGANVNSTDRYHNTPLVLSLRNYILRPNYSVAKCLIQHGSNLQDDNCASALEWTVEAHGNFDVVIFAIKAGFRPSGLSWVQDLLKGDPDRHRWFRTGYDNSHERMFMDFLREKVMNPSPLLLECRIAIREHLISTARPGSIYTSIQNLPVPDSIKYFLMMEDDD